MKLVYFKIPGNSLCTQVDAIIKDLNIDVKEVDVTKKSRLKTKYKIDVMPVILDVSDEGNITKIVGVDVLVKLPLFVKKHTKNI